VQKSVEGRGELFEDCAEAAVVELLLFFFKFLYKVRQETSFSLVLSLEVRGNLPHVLL